MVVFLNILKTVGIKLLWSFIGEKIIAKVAFGGLRMLAKRTTNHLDDEIVEDAYARYTGGVVNSKGQ